MVFYYCVGWPGSVHNARVFRNSGIYNKVTVDTILDSDMVHIAVTTIPLFIIGDSAYPLSKFFIKPFAHLFQFSKNAVTHRLLAVDFVVHLIYYLLHFIDLYQ